MKEKAQRLPYATDASFALDDNPSAPGDALAAEASAHGA